MDSLSNNDDQHRRMSLEDDQRDLSGHDLIIQLDPNEQAMVTSQMSKRSITTTMSRAVEKQIKA